MKNIIVVTCQFCRRTFDLTWEHREHKCESGVIHRYAPRISKPGKGYTERQAKKSKNQVIAP